MVARRQGMRVEAFAIGFGKPIFTWERDGVKWHICMLPFGGYVKIAGMQKEGNREPSEIPDGFYGKRPGQRIKVALAGPLVTSFFLFSSSLPFGFQGAVKTRREKHDIERGGLRGQLGSAAPGVSHKSRLESQTARVPLSLHTGNFDIAAKGEHPNAPLDAVPTQVKIGLPKPMAKLRRASLSVWPPNSGLARG